MTLGVLAHGAGSSAAVARTLLRPADLECAELRYLEDRSGDVVSVMNAFEHYAGPACDQGEHVVVGGISLGAHAAVRWAADRVRRGAVGPSLVIAALPAWTGPPNEVAYANRHSAQEVRNRGIDGVLQSLSVVDGDATFLLPLLALGWQDYTSDMLAQALDRAATGDAPTPADLRAIDVPTIVASWPGDPLHPDEVAAAWCELLPDAHRVNVTWDAMSVRIDAMSSAVGAVMRGLA